MEINNSLPIGTILKGSSYTYRIEKTLGQGSFGITYLASVKMTGALGSIDTNVKVAIKEFFMRDINGRTENTVTSGSKGGIYDDYRRKFKREVINLSKLQHPNIIKVIESFEANNTVYYAMEYISGGSLDDYIAKHNGLKEDEAIKIVRQIASALSFMHKNKMLHLDLKPSNIMRKESGDVVLIDFGLSKQYDANGEPESSTTVGAGTPGYAPLEQANYRDGKGFPVTMDVYALGATMFKMLTGVRPPEASDILNNGFPLDELQERGISEKLVDTIFRAMKPIVKDRTQSVPNFLSAFNGTAGSNKATDEATVISDADILNSRTGDAAVRDSNKYEVEKKRIKFVFKEGDKEIPISSIKPTLILNGRSVPIIDESYTFFGKEIYDVNIIRSGSLDYRIKVGCERIDLRQIKDICTIQVEHIFHVKISFSPYDKQKRVILSSSHGVFSNTEVRDILEATLPGYIEDYSYTIESKYYEYQSGRLSSLLKYIKLNSRIKATPSDGDGFKNNPIKTNPSNSDRTIDDPICKDKRTPWFLLVIGFIAAIVFLATNGMVGCGGRTAQCEPLDSDFVCVDTIYPDTFDVYYEDFSVKDVTFTMILVEGGTFRMGSNDGDSDEKPVHSVTLSSCYIGQTEVTQALWWAVMGGKSSYKDDNMPMENVSWENCQNFINKLNQLTGQKFRLPTEAEWEYAARGGRNSKGYKYSGSNTLGDVAWYDDNSDDNTHPVAMKQANELGLYDMSGNVWEWCQDLYGENYYKNSPNKNPTGPTSGSSRVIRGGCWCNSDRDVLRVSCRFSTAPSNITSTIGLRLALSQVSE